MKTLSIKLLSICLLVSLNSFAQDFQGIAIYKSAKKSLHAPESGGKDDKQSKELENQIAKAFQKEFTLVFNRNESLFKVNETLEKPNPVGGTIATASFSYEKMYINNLENRITTEREYISKRFLIKDSLQKKSWKVLNETKKIGEYTCIKAVIKKNYKKRVIESDGSFKFIDEEKDLIVWFTTQIPVSHGPAIYYGLPGLVLEVEDGNTTFLCTKIILNPKKEVEIKEPTKGEVVTQVQFDKIQQAKQKEAREKYKDYLKRRKN